MVRSQTAERRTKMHDKVQLNVLVPESIDHYIQILREETGINKSELVHLFIAYMRNNYTSSQIEELARDMLVFGERALRRDCHGNTT